MTLKEDRAAQKTAYTARVRDALAAAHEACNAAGNAEIERLPKDADGRLLPEGGSGAWVHVFAPSNKFRNALKQLGQLQRGDRGAWIISNFTEALRTQHYHPNKAGVAAACDVLRRAFPEEEGIFAFVYER